MNHQLLLASLQPGDTDFFRFSAIKGEHVNLKITVYDGDSIQVSLAEYSGEELISYDGAREVELDLTPTDDAHYVLSLAAHPDTNLTAFYHLVFPEDRGYLRPEVADGSWQRGAINVNQGSNLVFDSGIHEVAEHGFVNLGGALEEVRSSQQVVWVKQKTTSQYIEKSYAWDHELKMNAMVPHLTFRNDWDTRLEIAVADVDEDVKILVYSRTGVLLQEAELELDENGKFSDSLSNWLGQSAIRNGAWFEIDGGGAQITGEAVFSRERVGDFARVDVGSRPLNGDMVIFDLLDPSQGWNGLALVNTAGVG